MNLSYDEIVKISFDYNLEMEWDNLNRGLNSKNHSRPSALVLKMQENHVDLENKAAVLEFFKKEINENNLDIPVIQKRIGDNWQKIQKEAAARMNRLFEAKLDFDVKVFLTLNDRCAYNIDRKYFFVNLRSLNPSGIILHELLHFYTYEFILPEFKKRKISYDVFNDYKESLTFLLNIEFADLLEGWVDRGYEKQKEMRLDLEKAWPKYTNIQELTNYFFTTI